MLLYLCSIPITLQFIAELRICLQLLPLGLDALFHPCAHSSLLRQYICQLIISSTGISACCPLPTPFGLGLGPDLPWEDEPSSGILRLSTGEILTRLLATHASILSCVCSMVNFLSHFCVYTMLLYQQLKQLVNHWILLRSEYSFFIIWWNISSLIFPLYFGRIKFDIFRRYSNHHLFSITYLMLQSFHSVGIMFSPVYLRCNPTWPVSYYALFKCMAASKPTSWLSK